MWHHRLPPLFVSGSPPCSRCPSTPLLRRPSSGLVPLKSRRLPLRSLRNLAAAAAAGAVEAGEPYVGLGDEEPLGGEGDAESVAESEEVMVFSAALKLGSFSVRAINHASSLSTNCISVRGSWYYIVFTP